MNSSPLVNIVMVTYNQQDYISQAIESALNQKATFSFQLIISEDCSTDNTVLICKKYADSYPDKILFIQNKANLGLARNYEKAFNACSGKYIAILEGDDYWIDEGKIQKEVDMMESDSGIGLVHAGSYLLFEDSGKLVSPPKKMIASNEKKQGKIYELLIRDNFIYSATVMFRRSLLVEKINFKYFADNNVRTIDYAIWLGISKHSRVGFLKDVVAVYRVRSTSISNQTSVNAQEIFFHTVRLIVDYYLNLYPVEGFSILDFDNKVNEWLYSKSLTYGDFQSAKLYAGMIAKRSVKLKIMWSIVKTKFKYKLISFRDTVLPDRVNIN